MAQIHIDIDHIREIGHRIIIESNHVVAMSGDLRRAISSLDTWAWDGRSRWRAEPLLEQVRPQAIRLADDLYHLGRLLIYIAEQFENAEQDALLGITQHIDWEKTVCILNDQVEG